MKRRHHARRRNPISRGEKETLVTVAVLGAVGVGGYFVYRHYTDIVLAPGAMTTTKGSHRLVLPSGAKWSVGGGSASPTGLALIATPAGTSNPFSQTFTPSQSITVAWADATGMLQTSTITASA